MSLCKTRAIAVRKRTKLIEVGTLIHVDTRVDFTVQYTVMHTTAFTTHDDQALGRKSSH